MKHARRHALVIGGSGFIGHQIVEVLSDAGYIVHSMSRNTLCRRAQFILLVDRNDTGRLNALIADRKFDLMVDTCALSGWDIDGICDSQLMHRVDHWVHISSAALYSDMSTACFTESSLTGGAAHWGEYGRKKHEAEHAVLKRFTAHGARLTLLRPPYVYGPKNSSYREAFVWDRMKAGRAIPLPLKPCKVQFVHARDLARAILHIDRSAATAQTEILNIAPEGCIDLRQFCQAAVRAAGHKEWEFDVIDAEKLGISPREFFPFRTENLCLSVKAFTARYGGFDFMALDEGLKATYAAYQAA